MKLSTWTLMAVGAHTTTVQANANLLPLHQPQPSLPSSDLVGSSECFITAQLGCFEDTAEHRILNFTAAFGTHTSDFPTMSYETCAQACCAANFNGGDVLVGVEYGVQCYCGHGFAVANPPKSTACRTKCPGNSSQTCGGSDAINVYKASCPMATPTNPCSNPFPTPPPPTPAPTGPNYHGCMDPNSADTFEYCDVTKSDEDRVDALMGLLDLTDLITLLSPTKAPYCAVHTAAVSHVDNTAYEKCDALVSVSTDLGAIVWHCRRMCMYACMLGLSNAVLHTLPSEELFLVQL